MAAIEVEGEHDGRAVHAVTLRGGGGIRARLSTFGARLTELHVPDRDGRLADVVLGHDTVADHAASPAYFGATCGRYGNRIAGARFVLDDAEHAVDANEGPNHLHGGREGFDRKVWTLAAQDAGRAVFRAVSEDGEMGFPGRCDLTCTYALDGARLTVAMEAVTTRATPMNMVHHSYFNLAGGGDVLGHDLRIAADFYTPVGPDLLATGEIRSVAGTPFDFRAAKAIGQDIGALAAMRGYDHNWCLAGAGRRLRPCAEARDPVSGRTLTLHTTEPGVQVYTGGYLTGTMTGKRGRPLLPHAGFTLETQRFPGSPNHAQFPSAILRPGEAYRNVMVLAFGIG